MVLTLQPNGANPFYGFGHHHPYEIYIYIDRERDVVIIFLLSNTPTYIGIHETIWIHPRLVYQYLVPRTAACTIHPRFLPLTTSGTIRPLIMSSSILHQCPFCGHVSDISLSLPAFIENPHCIQVYLYKSTISF